MGVEIVDSATTSEPCHVVGTMETVLHEAKQKHVLTIRGRPSINELKRKEQQHTSNKQTGEPHTQIHIHTTVASACTNLRVCPVQAVLGGVKVMEKRGQVAINARVQTVMALSIGL